MITVKKRRYQEMKNVRLIVSKRELNKVLKDFLIAVDKSCGGDGKEVYLSQDRFFASIQNGANIKAFLYNIEYLLADGNDYQTGLGYICANMGQRASYTKGFAQITRILLHEYGHQMTYDTIIALYGEDAMDNLYQAAGSDNALYVSVPAEFVATQWAINWLADAENRKIAREFERKFWACFA
jgi:hypothetical protein